jgi:hypothetical protein
MSLTIRRRLVECYRRGAVRDMQPDSVFPHRSEYFIVVYNPPHDERIRHRRIIDSYSVHKYIYNKPLCMFR